VEAEIVELGRAKEALERELAVSQRVRPTELEELNLGNAEEPRNVLIAKELDTEFKEQLTNVLRTYKNVFAWLYEDMKGLNPEFYHNKINLAKDAIPVQRISPEPELCSKSQGRDRQASSGPLYQASQMRNMVKSNRGGAQEKWEIAGVSRLLEVERRHHQRRISIAIYRRSPRHGSWT
jgi:hypothetical protein